MAPTGRDLRRAALAAAAVLAAAGCGGSTTTVTVTSTATRTVTAPPAPTSTAPASSAPACSGDALTGSFAIVPGSAGAGQISYDLTLTNSSTGDCFVSGIPDVRLLDASGAPLPTHVAAARPGQALAARIVLAPGDSAHAQARFSPDVPGVGDHTPGPCQPKAAGMRVMPGGGGSLEVPVQPPTSVCEQGSLRFELLSAGG